MPEPQEDEVIIKVEASPINPSDLGLMFGLADMTKAEQTKDGNMPVITAPIRESFMAGLKARVDLSLAAGNEGAGVVVAAGSSDAAQALLGKVVGAAGGEMYSQYRAVKAFMCLPMPDGTTPEQAASCFVNPLTALSFTETMRMEDHTAIVHTAAASNLGQMLVKICKDEEVPLVNIVRKEEQEKILRDLGAEYVVNMSKESFKSDLVDALVATGATLGFDATGGGTLASDILAAMEIAANKTAKEYSRYGSDTFKQVYIYGGLERAQTTLSRAFGSTWALGGYLLTPFLQKVGIEKMVEMQQRVASEIHTTFKSSYTKEVSLAEVVSLDAIKVYGKQATGEKYLINPNKDL